MGIAEDIIIILIAGLIAAFIAQKIKLPPILGYIIAGIIIGPYTGGVTVTNIHQIELLAEIGVALLLFSIGLDISFKEIKEVRNIALLGTPVQLVLTIIYGFVIGYFMGLTWPQSVLLGTIISMSSTMIVIKTLMSRGLMGTLSSRVMIGVLIVQDLAAVPIMILIPQLNNLGQSLPLLGVTVLKGIFVLAFVIIFGGKLIPFILKQIARLNSRELFILTVTALGLGTGYGTYQLGLSFALGAFITGMVLNNSDYGHKALNDIIPIRDIFGLIFFTSVGMLIDPSFLFDNLWMILALVGLVIAGKFIVFALLSRLFGYVNVIPLAVGLGLAQVGEFSFVLARMGLNEKIFSNETYSIVLTASVLTMLISPFLSMTTTPLYSFENRFFKRERTIAHNIPQDGLHDHIIIAGGGRVGRYVASILHYLGYTFVMIEQNHGRFEASKNDNFPIIYGDASQESVLSAAHIAKSRLLLITIPTLTVSREIIDQGLRINPALPIIARGNTIEDAHELSKLSVSLVVQPEFEASLEIIRQSLLHLNISALAIQKYIDDIRVQKYSPRHNDDQQLLARLKNASFLLEMDWQTVPSNSPVADKSIKDLKIRTETGATVVGIYRGNQFFPNPEYSFVFQSGDIVAIIGTVDSRRLFEELIKS